MSWTTSFIREKLKTRDSIGTHLLVSEIGVKKLKSNLRL